MGSFGYKLIKKNNPLPTLSGQDRLEERICKYKKVQAYLFIHQYMHDLAS